MIARLSYAAINPETIIADIHKVHLKVIRLQSPAGNDHDARLARFKRRQAERTHTKLLQEAAALFGRRNDWTRTDNGFCIACIGKRNAVWDYHLDTQMFDHCIWYRGGGKCSAIISQPYDKGDNDEHAKEVAADHGVALHIPPHPFASFHFPGSTKFYVFTSPEHEVVWLPEQMHGGSDGKYF